MNNNDILRRIRYTFDFGDSQMINIFAHTGLSVTREQLCNWLKKEDDTAYSTCSDVDFAHFLNGLIIEKRGKKDGQSPDVEKKLNNNIILTKLKIALNLKAEDIITMLSLAGIKVGKSELSAFFRKSNHKNYRRCLDQFLRNFLDGITLKYREGVEPTKEFQWPEPSQINHSITPTNNKE